MMSQDQSGRRVSQASRADLDHLDSQAHLVLADPKGNQDQQELDHPDHPDSRCIIQPLMCL